jgi:hypothetical protein
MILEKEYTDHVPDGVVCYLQASDSPDEWGIKVGDVFLTNNRGGLWKTADRLRNTPYEKYIDRYAYGWFVSAVYLETDYIGEIR